MERQRNQFKSIEKGGELASAQKPMERSLNQNMNRSFQKPTEFAANLGLAGFSSKSQVQREEVQKREMMVENARLQSKVNQWQTEKFGLMTEYEEKLASLQSELYVCRDQKQRLEKSEQTLAQTRLELQRANGALLDSRAGEQELGRQVEALQSLVLQSREREELFKTDLQQLEGFH